MIKCNLMLNTHSCQVAYNNQKRELSWKQKKQQQLFMLQVVVKENPDKGIILKCELSEESYL